MTGTSSCEARTISNSRWRDVEKKGKMREREEGEKNGEREDDIWGPLLFLSCKRPVSMTGPG